MSYLWIATDRQIGKLIRLGREEKKSSQLNLELTIGIDQSRISKIENGLVIMSIKDWLLLATALDIPKSIIYNERLFDDALRRMGND